MRLNFLTVLTKGSFRACNAPYLKEIGSLGNAFLTFCTLSSYLQETLKHIGEQKKRTKTVSEGVFAYAFAAFDSRSFTFFPLCFAFFSPFFLFPSSLFLYLSFPSPSSAGKSHYLQLI